MEEFTREIGAALAAPFPADEVEFLPRAVQGGKALGVAYIDARSVMNRLDFVVGPGGWSFDFDLLADGGKMVRGRLTVLGVTKCDAGEASTEDEILKSAVSDALKRCAVHFGIGRYLYYLPKVWAPYDAQKRRFTERPRLDERAVQHALTLCGQAPSAFSPPPSTPESAGDRAAQVTGALPPEVRGQVTTAAPLLCTGCQKALTRGQHDISVRSFGQPFCPTCQKAHSRA